MHLSMRKNLRAAADARTDEDFLLMPELMRGL